MTKLILPKSLLELEDKDRDEIVAVLLQASQLPTVKQLPFRTDSDEHNMWERNVDTLMADAEDEFYEELAREELARMIQLMVGLGLPINPEQFEKSLEPEFHAFEDELLKAKDNGRQKITKLIAQMAEVTKAKTKKFMDWLQDGKAFKRDEMTKIIEHLAMNPKEYAKKAEAYMTRAGFIGKIRGEAERQNFEVLGAIIDKFPETVALGEKQGVELTARRAQQVAVQTGKTIKVLPLTPREAEGVKHAVHHAGDKITEISARHMSGVRQLVIQAKKERWSAQQLASKLFDKFGDHNRDWRRVAITELSFATNDAYLSGIEEGETVVGMGAQNACPHCKRYVIGKTFTVTHNPPSEDTYEGDMKQVWAGKSNYGRKVAEYRPAIPMHPNCRCRWHRISRFYRMGENGKLELKTTAELIQEEREKRGLGRDPKLDSSKGQPLSQEELAKKAEEVLRKLGG